MWGLWSDFDSHIQPINRDEVIVPLPSPKLLQNAWWWEGGEMTEWHTPAVLAGGNFHSFIVLCETIPTATEESYGGMYVCLQILLHVVIPEGYFLFIPWKNISMSLSWHYETTNPFWHSIWRHKTDVLELYGWASEGWRSSGCHTWTKKPAHYQLLIPAGSSSWLSTLWSHWRIFLDCRGRRGGKLNTSPAECCSWESTRAGSWGEPPR